VIDCILVTHGDADHFAGLSKILESETNKEARKRLFIQPERYFHNGIVKRPGKLGGKTLKDTELLGPTKKKGTRLFLTGLVDDLLKVDASQMNEPFCEWTDALKEYNRLKPLKEVRLQFGDDQAFAFFNQCKLKIEVLSPLTQKVDG
jgi:metal-dependent hydrolase (beta-lactamase superfamily II)